MIEQEQAADLTIGNDITDDQFREAAHRHIGDKEERIRAQRGISEVDDSELADAAGEYVARSAMGPIDLAERGFDKLTAADIREIEARGRTKRTAASEAGIAPIFGGQQDLSAQDAPAAGIAFTAKQLYDVLQAGEAIEAGTASRDQQRLWLSYVVDSRRDRTLGGGVVGVGKSIVSTGLEFLTGATAGKVAAKTSVAGLRKMVGDQTMAILQRRARSAAASATGRYAAATGKALGIAGSTAATTEGASRLAGALGIAPEGGAWNAAAALRALEGLADVEDGEEAAILLNETWGDFLDALSYSEAKGFGEMILTNSLEQAGGLIGRVPGLSYLQALETKVLQKIAGKAGPLGARYQSALERAQFQGGLNEVAEELVQGMTTEAVFGTDPMNGLPDDFQELVEMFLAMSIPGVGGAIATRRRERRAEIALERAEQAGENASGTEKAPTQGGDSVSPEAPTDVNQGVAEGVGEAEQMSAAAQTSVTRSPERRVRAEAAPADATPTPYEAEATPPPSEPSPIGPVRRSPTPRPDDVDKAPQPDLAPQDAFLGPPPKMDQSHIGRQMWGSLTDVREPGESRSTTAPEITNALGGIIRAAGQDPVIREGLASNVPRGAAGAYWLKQRVIDVRKVNDVVTAAHEVAHHLERAVWGQKDPWRKGGAANISAEARVELDRLGRELYGEEVPNRGYLREGWAQYLSFYVTQDGRRDTPALTEWFEGEFLPAHPKVARAIEKSRDLARVWRQQGAVKRAQASIVESPTSLGSARRLARETFSREGAQRTSAFVEDWFFEEFGPVRRAVASAKKESGEELPAGQDPFRLLNALRGTAGSRVRAMALHGMIDIHGNRTGVRALRDVKSMVKGRNEDFVVFLFAQRARALWEQPVVESLQDGQTVAGVIAERRSGLRDPTTGQEPSTEQLLLELGARDPGLSYVDTLQVLDEYADANFEPAAEVVYQWFDGVMDYVAASSPTLAQAVHKIRQIDPGYFVPLMREFIRLPGRGQRVSTAAGGRVSQRLKGSGRRVKNPLEQLLGRAVELVQMAHERRALDAFIAMGKRHDGLGGLIREVPVTMVPGGAISVDEALREAAKRVGAESPELGGAINDIRGVLGESADAVITMFQQAQRPKTDGGAPILPVVENGKVKWYQMEPSVFEVFANVNPSRINGVVDLVLGAPKRWFVQGTTGLNPAFAFITNPLRDIQTLLVNTSAGNPFRAFGLALGSIKDSFEASMEIGSEQDSYARFLVRSGMPIRSMLAQDTSATRAEARVITAQGGVKEKVSDAWDAYARLLGAPEFISRIAEMKVVGKRLGWEPGQPVTADMMVELMEAGKGVTVDFAAAGRFTRAANRYIPFFNVAFQSVRSFSRAVRRDPKAAAVRGLATLTVPTIAYWLSVKDEPWYQEMEDRQRYSYWYLPVGDELVRVPRAFEQTFTFATTFEIMLNSMFAVNPEAAEEFASRFSEGVLDLGSDGVRTFAPNALPSIGEAYLEHQRNEDSFFGTPIIPRNLEEASPEFQFNEYTSRAAKIAGKALGVSPILIEHYTESVFGTVAREGFRLTGNDMDEIGAEAGPSETVFVGRIFQRGGNEGVRSRSVSAVYDLAAELRTRRINLLQQDEAETPEQRQERLWAQDAIRALSALSDIKRYTVAGDERRELLKRRRELAAEILDDHKAGRWDRDRARTRRRELEEQATALEEAAGN